LGLCDATPPIQKPSRNWKNELFPHAIQKPIYIFLRQAQFLKAGAMGVVLAVSFFLAMRGPPSHNHTSTTTT
jgi:hypothetical protein